MPPYLIPLPKTENGREIEPWQSAGGKAFDPDDAESMEFLKRLYIAAQQEIQPRRRSLLTPVFALFGLRYPPENPTVTSFRERWERPFEDILAEATAAPDAYKIRAFDSELLKDNRYLSRVEVFPWFPIYTVHEYEDPDGETVANRVVSADIDAEMAYFQFFSEERNMPDDMSRIAAIFDGAAAKYVAEEGDDSGKDDVFAVRAASEWLRFWADRRHPCQAQNMLWSGQGWYRIEV